MVYIRFYIHGESDDGGVTHDAVAWYIYTYSYSASIYTYDAVAGTLRRTVLDRRHVRKTIPHLTRAVLHDVSQASGVEQCLQLHPGTLRLLWSVLCRLPLSLRVWIQIEVQYRWQSRADTEENGNEFG